jgi:hypothetical protein
MPDPCGSEPGYKRIVACFIERLMMDHNSRSATVCGYAESVNTLFRLRSLSAPANLSDRTNMCARIILVREKEEDIAKQQSPITRKMFAALCDLANKASANLLEAVVADWFKFINITGLRCAEYAQKTQSAFNKDEYPSGKRVVKAFIPTDWTFYDSSGTIMNIHPLTCLVQVFPARLKVPYRIQKNRRNGQCITLVADNDHPDICPVQAAYRILLSAKRLDQSDSQPMAVFVNKQGMTRYLTGKKISDILQSIARAVHPDLLEDAIKHYSSHSGQVWALVLLDKASMTPDFMKSCLHWMGESYRLYLCNTSILQRKHVDALSKESDKVMQLLGSNRDILPNIVPVDDKMGEY